MALRPSKLDDSQVTQAAIVDLPLAVCDFEQDASPAELCVFRKTHAALGSSVTDPWTGKSLARVPSWALGHAQKNL